MQEQTALAPAEAEAVKVPESPQQPELNAPKGESEQASAAKSEPEKQDADPSAEKKRTASGRIAELHAQKKQAEAQRDYALEEARRLRAALDKTNPAAIESLPFEQQEAARLKQAVQSAQLDQKIGDLDQAATNARQLRAATFQAKIEEAIDRMPDLHQKFGSIPLSEAAADLIAESDHAAEVAYFLGNNPREAHRIYGLPAHLQGAEIARIEARVSAPSPMRKVSQAPSPVPTLGGSRSPALKDPADMTFAEYEKMRMGTK